jgi:hypothetical protein
MVCRPEQTAESCEHEGSGGIDHGLYGAVIVRRPGEPLPDKSFTLVMIDTTFNGLRFPHTPLLEAKEGERIEFVVMGHGDLAHLSSPRPPLGAGHVPVLDTRTVGPPKALLQVIAGRAWGQAIDVPLPRARSHGHGDAGFFRSA